MEVVRLSNVSYRYSRGSPWIVRRVTLSIGRGERVLLAGDSGSGKTTLLRIVSGLIPSVYGGELLGVVERRGRAVMVPQFFDAYMLMPTVEEELAYAAGSRGWGLDRVWEEVSRVAGEMGIEGLLGRRISALSTGERQRVAIASALVMEPEILLLDEPLAYLDPLGVESLLGVLSRIRVEAIVIAEHRIHYLRRWATRIVAMDGGRIVYDGPVDGYEWRWPPCSVRAKGGLG